MQPTLASTFAEIRARKELTLLDVGTKCDLNQTTILKIEQGKRSVRWETVHLALSVGMGIHPTMEEYEACRALWWADRQKFAEGKSADANKTALSKPALHALAVCRKVIAGLEDSEMKRFEAHARRFKPRS